MWEIVTLEMECTVSSTWGYLFWFVFWHMSVWRCFILNENKGRRTSHDSSHMQVQSVLEPYCFILKVSADLAFKDIPASVCFQIKTKILPQNKTCNKLSLQEDMPCLSCGFTNPQHTAKCCLCIAQCEKYSVKSFKQKYLGISHNSLRKDGAVDATRKIIVTGVE